MKQRINGNILMVANFPSDTAYAWWLMEHFWRTLADLFVKAGNKAYLAYPKITKLSENINNSEIIPIELSIPWSTREESLCAKSFIRENNISHIYFTDKPYFNLQYAMMRLNGVQRIIVHDHTPGDRPPIRGLKGTFKLVRNTISFTAADKVLCVSDLMRQRNIENARVPPNKCAVVQNGIQPITCITEKCSALRASMGIRPTTTLVITTGRAHPYKGFDFIIECANRLRSRQSSLDVIFLLVGDGPAIPNLKAMLSDLNLEESVRLLGFRSDVRDLLCISDIALHASLGEGFALSIIEYMSAGLPVFVPDIPSVSQAIEHDKTGIVYPKGEPEIVAAQIQELTTNSKRRIAMGNAAKTQADCLYSLERCTQSFVSEVEKIYYL